MLPSPSTMPLPALARSFVGLVDHAGLLVGLRQQGFDLDVERRARPGEAVVSEESCDRSRYASAGPAEHAAPRAGSCRVNFLMRRK